MSGLGKTDRQGFLAVQIGCTSDGSKIGTKSADRPLSGLLGMISHDFPRAAIEWSGNTGRSCEKSY
jgi:hypothetical protein